MRQVWRDCYALASLFKTSLDLQNPSKHTSDRVSSGLRQLDLGIMMGGPAFRHLLDMAVRAMERGCLDKGDEGRLESFPCSENGQKRRQLLELTELSEMPFRGSHPKIPRLSPETQHAQVSSPESDLGATIEEVQDKSVVPEDEKEQPSDFCPVFKSSSLPPGSLLQSGRSASRPTVMHLPR